MGCLVLEDIEVELEATEAELLANDCCCPKTTFEDALLRMTAVILGDLNLDLGCCSKTPVRLLLSVALEETLHPTKVK